MQQRGNQKIISDESLDERQVIMRAEKIQNTWTQKLVINSNKCVGINDEDDMTRTGVVLAG